MPAMGAVKGSLRCFAGRAPAAASSVRRQSAERDRAAKLVDAQVVRARRAIERPAAPRANRHGRWQLTPTRRPAWPRRCG